MSALQDCRLALRLFRRTPLATGIALVSIALSVGAASVVFAAIKSVLIDPMPYARASEIVQFRSEFTKAQRQASGDWVVWNDLQELTRRTRTLRSIGGYANAVFDLAGDSGTPPEALYGTLVTASLFPMLGVSPMLGRNILPEEDQRDHPEVMILSYGLWARRFHSDPNIVGRTVTVSGHDCLVIGVMAPNFNFPMRRAAAHTPEPYVEFWAAPLKPPANQLAGLGAAARLRPGVSLTEARQDLISISDRLAREFPETNRDRVLQMDLLAERTVGSAGNPLLLLMGATVLFMLIGCANVASLLLARGLERRREIAVRLAVGASQLRIVGQFLTESCLLAAVGGIAGYLLSAAAWSLLPAIAPLSIPRLAAARADFPVFAFAVGVTIVNGVLFGMAPALRFSRARAAAPGETGSMRVAGRTDHLSALPIVGEVALSLVLVAAGGQLIGSFVKLISIDPGFLRNQVIASVVLPSPVRYPDPEKRAMFYRRILDSVRALGGVESAGAVNALPFSGENHGGFVSGPGGATVESEIDVVGGDYLQTLGIRLLDGRWFHEEDSNESGDAAIVNDFIARRLWPGQNAIGQRVCVSCTPESPSNWKRVIGVVSSARHIALNESIQGNVYLAAGAMREAVFVVARTRRSLGETEKALRRAIAALDPHQPVLLSASMSALIADSVADRRFVMLLLAITAGIALVLAAAGVYGVVSYATSRRTREFGIRVACGATPWDVRASAFRSGFLRVGLGLAIGTAAAVAAEHSLRGLLLGMESINPACFGIAFCPVLLAAGIACWIPARRASRIDPSSALRQE